MENVFTPGNIIVFVIVSIGLVVGIRRALAGLMRGQSCCSDGTAARRHRGPEVLDVDESHYPFEVDLCIGGMSCQGCAATVTDALNSVSGTWATVDLATKTAHIRSKEPVDIPAYEAAVRDAGYRVLRP